PIHPSVLLALLLIRRPPSPTLFPYTTLFRSLLTALGAHCPVRGDHIHRGPPLREPLGDHVPRLRGAGQQHPPALEVHGLEGPDQDRKSTRLNSSHVKISYAVFCLKKKKKKEE